MGTRCLNQHNQVKVREPTIQEKEREIARRTVGEVRERRSDAANSEGCEGMVRHNLGGRGGEGVNNGKENQISVSWKLGMR